MEALFISFSTVTVAEMGDRTQLLSLMLVARYGRPWAILAGILFATLANHLAAGFLGAWFGGFLDRIVLDIVAGVSMIVMALWASKRCAKYIQITPAADAREMTSPSSTRVCASINATPRQPPNATSPTAATRRGSTGV
jgi:putative Ca2+/H+ antiporter (TMEM165/GDT1 family)